jgi:hypothetical protein
MWGSWDLVYCRNGSNTVVGSTSWVFDPTSRGCLLHTKRPLGIDVFHGAALHR